MRFKTGLLGVLLTALCLGTVYAQGLNYPEFTDPDKIIKPGNFAQWQQQAVRYPEKIGSKVDLYISLDQQQYHYLEPLIQRFAQQAGIIIKVDNGTCGISAGLLRKKAVDMGGFCCPPGKLDRLPGLQFHTLGIAGLAIIANRTVPVRNLSTAQARQVFTGEITRWSELSEGKKADSIDQISPIIRPHCKKRPGHWRLLAASSQDFCSNSTEVAAITDMIKLTAMKPGAIGYEIHFIVERFEQESPLKILTIDGIHPDNNEALAKGKYPFYRTYSITSWQDSPKKSLSLSLVKWLRHEIAQGGSSMVGIDTLKKNGWVFRNGELIASPGKDGLFGQRE